MGAAAYHPSLRPGGPSAGVRHAVLRRQIAADLVWGINEANPVVRARLHAGIGDHPPVAQHQHGGGLVVRANQRDDGRARTRRADVVHIDLIAQLRKKLSNPSTATESPQ